MGILDAIFSAAFEGDGFNPVMGTSTNYKHWVSVEDWKRCIECAKNHTHTESKHKKHADGKHRPKHIE